MFQERFQELGGDCVLGLGMGDDKDEDRWETKWNEWLPELWNELGTEPPVQELLPPSYNVNIDETGTSAAAPDIIVPTGSSQQK